MSSKHAYASVEGVPNLYTRNGQFIYRLNQNGKKVPRNLTREFKVTNLEGAVAWIAKHKEQGHHQRKAPDKHITVKKAFETILDRREIKGRKGTLDEHTVDLYRGVLTNHVYPVWHGGTRKLIGISPDDVIAVIDSLDEKTWKRGKHGEPKPYSTATKEWVLTVISSLLNTATQKPFEYRPDNPARDLGLDEPEAGDDEEEEAIDPETVLSPEEVERVIANLPNGSWLNPRWRAMIMLARTEGLRISEVCGLGRADVDLEKGVIHLKQQLRGSQYRAADKPSSWYKPLKGRRSKANNKARDLPLAPLAREELRRYLAWASSKGLVHISPDAPFFATREGRPVNQASLSEVFAAAVEKADLKRPIVFHSLRHTFASMMFARGASMEAVSILLGHSSPEVTRKVYVRLENQETRFAQLAAMMEQAV
jgi:integrase